MSSISLNQFLENGYSQLVTKGAASFKKKEQVRLSFLLVSLFSSKILATKPFSITEDQANAALRLTNQLREAQKVSQKKVNGCASPILRRPIRSWSLDNPSSLAREAASQSYAILKSPFQDSRRISSPNEALVKEYECLLIRGTYLLYQQLGPTPKELSTEDRAILHRLLFFHRPLPNLNWFTLLKGWLGDEAERYPIYQRGLLSFIPEGLCSALPYEQWVDEEVCSKPFSCIQNYVIECSIVLIEKQLGLKFAAEMRNELAKNLQDEHVRLDLVHYFTSDVDVKKYRERSSYPLMRSFEIYKTFSRFCEFPSHETEIRWMIYRCDHRRAEKLLPKAPCGKIDQTIAQLLSLIDGIDEGTFELLSFFMQKKERFRTLDILFKGWGSRMILIYLKRADLSLISQFNPSQTYSFDAINTFSQQNRLLLSVFEQEEWFIKKVMVLKHATLSTADPLQMIFN